MKFCIAVFLCFLCNIAFGQREQILYYKESDKKLFNFGIQLGVGAMGFYITPSEDNGLTYNGSQNVNATSQIAFEVAGIASLNFWKHFSLKFIPGVYVSNSKINWEIVPDSPLDTQREVQTIYFNLPLSLRVATARMNNLRPFVEFGSGVILNMTGKQKDGRDNYEGIFRVKTDSYFLSAGMGTEIYFPYFKLGVYVKGMWGLNNLVIRDYRPDSNYTSPIDKMTLNAYFLTFTFE